MVEHLLGGLVDRAAPGCDVLVGFPLPSQPLGREEPRLVGGDGHIAADRDRPIVVYGELHLIALTDVEGAADLVRQGELRLRPHLRPGPQARLGLHLGCRHAHDVLQRSDFLTLLLYHYESIDWTRSMRGATVLWLHRGHRSPSLT